MVTLVDEGAIELYKCWAVVQGQKPIQPVTVRHNLHALSKFFGYAMKQHWCRDNPVRNVKIPSDRDAVRIHVVTAAEEKKYFAGAAKNRNLFDLGRLMLNQGMRPEEIVSLAKADIDLERNTLRIRERKT